MTGEPSWPTGPILTGRLLRASRVHDPAHQFANAKAFAATFPGGYWCRAAGESQISRWETGVQQAPLAAVRRYEQLLNLHPGQLTGPLQALGRYRSSGRGSRPALPGGPAADPEAVRGRLGDLLDLIDCDGDLVGSDWDELTTLLAHDPVWTIAPRRLWQRTAERLVTEMIISDGLAWQQRFEALNRLMHHRDGQHAAIAACADLAADPANRVMIEVVSMFDATAAPEAATQVLRQLHRPTNDGALYGALLACIRKIQHRHFTGDQSLRLSEAVRALARDTGGPADIRALGARVLDRLSGSRPVPIAPRMSTQLDRRVAGAIGGTSDEVFCAMVAEMFNSPFPDVRLYSAMYLAASPFREPIARETLAATMASVTTDPATSVAGLEALQVIGGAAERTRVERLLLAPGIPAAVTANIARTLAHIGGRSGTPFWRAAVHTHAGREDVLVPLVYALGITGEDDVLRAVRTDVALRHDARQAAAWWLGLPRQARTRARA
ncbi:hypothetical protein [Rugosimonospora africana]|uniref:Uncharacterized protein n=1 Tax=Rugosimonospora africana TaxID=556532 RepID=A0A8J3VSI5_9ACTN|nr:hypothetical protein [Rugosimonospora africana]GIH16646.1 hypothetical protein Raf01_48180 [Rugosimonospora africana]